MEIRERKLRRAASEKQPWAVVDSLVIFFVLRSFVFNYWNGWSSSTGKRNLQNTHCFAVGWWNNSRGEKKKKTTQPVNRGIEWKLTLGQRTA